MAEIYNNKPDKSKEIDRELSDLSRASREQAANKLERERNVESGKDTPAKARHEALELAKSRERKDISSEHAKDNIETRHDRIASKAERKKAYDNIMNVTRTQMSAPARTFSKIIHNPAVEKTSEVIGATVARPNAILAGSVSALILVLGVYAIAHFFGYPLSGFETIGAFILGWLIGIIYDFFHAMVTGKVS